MKQIKFIVLASLTSLIFIMSCTKVSTDELIGEEMMVANQIIPNSEDTEGKKLPCTAIPSGLLVDSEGEVILPGYNKWGHNYQARTFNGYYCDSYRGAAWCQPYNDVRLMMKWNDAWLSNQDCDGDGLLDRHYGHPSYIGSGAWLTNHQSGTYVDENGNECSWNYFVKIVAAPLGAYKANGLWYNPDHKEIGPVIWGSFAIIQQVENDPCAGHKGLQFNSPDRAGLGNW